ncbi:MAG: ABC transporter permease [Sulfuricurvum sp.]|nr:ABC transporter permease [Sulfuricurvum sp.]
MNIVPFLVKRFLRFDKEQPFISLSALLAFSGIALGVMVLIIAMALMNGFDNEFKKKLTVMNYPLTIQPKFFGTVDTALVDDLRLKFPDLAFSPYVTSAVLARSGDQMEGGYLFGVDFAQEKKVNAVLAKGLKNGVPKGFEVMIGQTLKEEFMLQEREKLTYIFTQMEPGGMVLAPKMKRFAPVATFNSGLSAYDKGFSYTSIDAMQRILGIPENLYDGIHIYSPNPEADIHRIAAVLPDTVSIRGWWEENGNFFAALKMEKMSLFIVLMLIILIAAINIISSLLMTVMNRRSEIALLISLGASKAEVKKIFLILGVVIGALGITTGAILGFLGMWILGTFEIISLPIDVYPTSTLPLDLSPVDFFSIIIGAFVIVLLSAWYPQ